MGKNAASNVSWKNKFLTHLSWMAVSLLMLVLVIGLGVLGWLFYYKSRALPGLQIMQTAIGGNTREQIENLVEQKLGEQETVVTLTSGARKWEIDLSEVNYKVDIQRTAYNSLAWGKEWPSILQVVSLSGNTQDIPLVYAVDHGLLEEKIRIIQEEIDSPAIEPEIQVSENGAITAQQGTLGREVESEKLAQKIAYLMTWRNEGEIEIPVVEKDLRVSEEKLEAATERAGKWLGKSLVLSYGENEIVWSGAKLAGLVNINQGFSLNKILDASELLAESVNRPAKDAVFEFDNDTGRVREFRAQESGLELSIEPFVQNLNQTLTRLETEATDSAVINLPIVEAAPKITAEGINNLGINELLGMGESHFKGSIPSRAHNINVSGTRIHGIVIAPGESFSFIKEVGEISAATGYQPGYIILNGQTVLGDGGGVCQVSTTVFRAAINTGLPITQWKAHSYRVSYYEQQSYPGLDATIYPPSVDLKFTNDTPGHILVQTMVDLANGYMKVEIYGTNDGREVETTTPRLWDIIQPAEDMYIDDPNLPMGQVKQTEQRINGAKAAFDWKVTRNGEVLHERTFTSVYRPWQAVYLRGTKPI